LCRYVKVYPRDYKRVIEAQRAAAANAAEAEAEGAGAFEKLKAMSSLNEAPVSNNITQLRPTRLETATNVRGFVEYEREVGLRTS
jgi:glutamate synthase (NADPH/NADH)